MLAEFIDINPELFKKIKFEGNNSTIESKINNDDNNQLDFSSRK